MNDNVCKNLKVVEAGARTFKDTICGKKSTFTPTTKKTATTTTRATTTTKKTTATTAASKTSLTAAQYKTVIDSIKALSNLVCSKTYSTSQVCLKSKDFIKNADSLINQKQLCSQSTSLHASIANNMRLSCEELDDQVCKNLKAAEAGSKSFKDTMCKLKI